jgi:WD40 repeat protein
MSTSPTTLQRQEPTTPPAFLCALTQQIMNDPVLSLCGHLFERTVVEAFPACPIDQSSITTLIPFNELKREIETWKAHILGSQEVKSYAQALIPSSSAAVPKQKLGKQDGSVRELENGLSKMGLQEKKGTVREKKRAIRPINIVRNAHTDDIHGFVSISPECFVSGSKDNDLKMWNISGELIQPLVTEASQRGYKYWVTALSKFSNGYWASGTRDGYITIWNSAGRELANIEYNPSKGAKGQYVCKERNKSRINCITELETTDHTTTFYTGTPKYIQLWDGRTGRFLRGYKASDNDWVYCIEVLENKDLLVVIGSDLEYWDMKTQYPNKHRLIQETRQEHRARQRPHISAVTRLDHDRNMLASALFDGSVKIVDIAAQRLLCDYREHVGRVWSVMNLSPQILASSADDRTIKIWDVRQPSSTLTIAGNPGRVSSLLRLSETILISGSCPDDVFASEEKASITFWDIRKIV